jgi:DNA-binding MarR family transcriptional regulator/N-acetylglutamate synthase-like GNAT family acetyltransferase
MKVTNDRIQAVRRFNRFYTRRIGVLGAGHLHSQFTLTEVRVLYEVAHRRQPTASEISTDLDLDPGYLSRILRKFEQLGYIARKRSSTDSRQTHLSLTRKGTTVFAPLDRRANLEVAEMLGRMSDREQSRVLQAMSAIESALGPATTSAPSSYVLRQHRPGDMGMVIHRHGVLYNQEYGWDERFEALVADIAARFIQDFDPARERCWIAERDGQFLGCVFLVRKSANVAKLRMLLVEPSARGIGLGKRLVDECIRFARQAGYRKVTLWTNNILHTARHIYEQAGFKLVHEGPHEEFGEGLIAQTWDLKL